MEAWGLLGKQDVCLCLHFIMFWELSRGRQKEFIARKMFPLRIFANKNYNIGESFLDHREFEASYGISIKMI